MAKTAARKRAALQKRISAGARRGANARRGSAGCSEPSTAQKTHRAKLRAAGKACGGTKTKKVTRAVWKACMKKKAT